MEINGGRLEELEIKLMDLENSLQELNQVVISQAAEFSALRLAHQQLLTQFAAFSRPDQQSSESDNEPPPHYLG